MLGIGLQVWTVRPASGSDTTPGGTNSVLLLANGTDGFLLADGSSFLILAG